MSEEEKNTSLWLLELKDTVGCFAYIAIWWASIVFAFKLPEWAHRYFGS